MKKYSKQLRSTGMLVVMLFAGAVLAASAEKIDRESDKALDVFRDEVSGSEIFLQQAAGYLVFPRRLHCGGCHSHALVTSQRADRQTWQDIIRWMQETQNLWLFDPDTEAQILDYLADNYPPQPNRRRAPIPPSLMPATTADVQ